MLKDAFGQQLKRTRKEAGLTQEALADASGIGWRFLQEIEAGDKQPTISTVFKLAKALNTKPGVLLDEIFLQWREND